MEKEKEKMSYDLIYQVYQKERQGALLTKLDQGFYERIATLIKGLSDEYEAESRNNPASTKCMMLYDELKKIRTLFHEIYEYRIRKIVLMALTGASEGTVDTKSLVDQEIAVFEQLKAILKRGYDDVDRVGSGCPITSGPPIKVMTVDATPPTVPTRPSVDAKAVDTAVAPTNEKVVAEPVVKKKKVVPVQILEDIPKFAAEGGETYTLKKKDYVSLPLPMAERLEKQGKARIMPS